MPLLKAICDNVTDLIIKEKYTPNNCMRKHDDIKYLIYCNGKSVNIFE